MKCKLPTLMLLALFMLIGLPTVSAQNLLNNGGFEQGYNVGYQGGQTPNYNYLPAPTGSTTSGNWALTTNPQPYNTTSFIACTDHTSGTGNMMIVDGKGNNERFWKAGTNGGGICSLTVGATYTFSYWIRSIYTTVNGTRAIIRVNFNNVSTVSQYETTAPLTANGWQQVVYTFKPSNSCVNIELSDTNGDLGGNDFAIDDLSLTAPLQPLSLTYSLANPTCIGANNGSITVYGINGLAPYLNYAIGGAITQNNTTGVFTGLAPGTYTVSITDSNNNTSTLNNIIVSDPADLTVSNNTSICTNGSANLTVSGSTAGYNWTASPNDASLTASNNTLDAITVNPTQTTVYTVTSNPVYPVNLVYNGNFSLGNVGFATDYTYYSPNNNVTYAQKAYGIVTNPQSWESGFITCTDHSSGVGKMMVIDGSTSNGGNDVIWSQTIGVTPNTNYTLTYYLMSASTITPSDTPAQIKVTINGIQVSSVSAPSTTCVWIPITYTWNSGTATSAQIKFFDQNTLVPGNDFALDDISFIGNITCALSKSVTVTINPVVTPTLSCGFNSLNSVSFNWIPVSGASGYTISYTVNGGSSVNVGSINATTYLISGLSTNNTVVITVLPTGSGCYAAANYTCNTVNNCPTPEVSVTQQPSCTTPTGTIVFTGPVNVPLTTPSDIFISEVTDEDLGSLTYVELYNGTGVTKNLANYRLKVYNNGGTTTSCDFYLLAHFQLIPFL